MNSRLSSNSKRAFTLIEMLVVITIIGILASLVASAASGAIKKAKRVKTQAALKDIVLAIKNYQVEYNRYPLPQGHTGEEPIPLSSGATVLKILLGANEGKMNPRTITFLEPAAASKGGAGGLTGSDGSQALNDPWGVAYEVIMDANYDNKIANPDSQNADATISKGAPRDLIVGAIAMSSGEDKKKHTKDDVVSWRP